ncbi:MAG: hypothetical protein NC293_10815 [Roseburia sp.]|nr:hypothetical protein [Roseburia sp.]
MGFMSLVFAAVYFIIMMAGALNLLIAAIIFLVRFIKKKRNKKVGRLSKVFAIVLLVMGLVAEGPLILMLVVDCWDRLEEKHIYDSLDNKVSINADYADDEFEYNGETLVRLDKLGNDSFSYEDEVKTEFVANLTFNDSEEDYVYAVLKKAENASGCDIYIRNDSYNASDQYYVKKEDQEKVIQYYQSEAECIAQIYYNRGSDGIDVDIDLKRFRDIEASEKTEEKWKESEELGYYELEISSSDCIWGGEYSFSFFEDCVLFRAWRNSDDGVIEGDRLSEEDEKYIREVFGKAMEARGSK